MAGGGEGVWEERGLVLQWFSWLKPHGTAGSEGLGCILEPPFLGRTPIPHPASPWPASLWDRSHRARDHNLRVLPLSREGAEGPP